MANLIGRSWALPPKRRDGDEVVELHYSERPSETMTPGFSKLGRYIGWSPEKAEHVDEHAVIPQVVHEGRENAELRIATTGFELLSTALPEAVDFDDDDAVRSTYYEDAERAIRAAYQAASQRVRKVVVFDHTRRSTDARADRLNALTEGGAAAPVGRVHCDYTKASAPRRLAQLAEKPSYTGATVSPEDAATSGRYAFVNLWRSTDRAHPVRQSPLALCDPRRLDVDDRALVMIYELCYEDRVGENYALDPDASTDCTWWYFRDMTADEAIVFSVFDSDATKPGFVFHTAFDLPPPVKDNPFDLTPPTPPDLPPRQSIEVRAIVFFEDD
mmetsp:Transcript_5808/g.24252  ORF Transcript_5808/g.24252 Transcript_5808/m.24252 type:complete len:330 (-) Transcript_5808:1021-2010(-)